MNDIMAKDEVEVFEESSDLTVINATLKEYRERIELLEKENTELSDKLSSLDRRLTDHTDKEPMSDEQVEELKRLGATIIFSMLGDRETEEYQAHHMIFFGHLWSDFRKEFHLGKVKNLPKKKFLAGMDFIESWEPREGVQGLMDSHDRAMTAKKAHDVKIFLEMARQMNQEAKRSYDNN